MSLEKLILIGINVEINQHGDHVDITLADGGNWQHQSIDRAKLETEGVPYLHAILRQMYDKLQTN